MACREIPQKTHSESEIQKIPVVLILGDKDIENQTVSVCRTEGDPGALFLGATLAFFTQWTVRDRLA